MENVLIFPIVRYTVVFNHYLILTFFYFFKEYDGFKVDIWALGVLLFFMLVGVTPFRGETVHDLKRNILNGTYTVPDYISTFAQHLIWRMLCMSPSKRASILELKVKFNF